MRLRMEGPVPRALGSTGLRVGPCQRCSPKASPPKLRLNGGVRPYVQDPRLSGGGHSGPAARCKLTGALRRWSSGAMSGCCGTAGWVECDHTAEGAVGGSVRQERPVRRPWSRPAPSAWCTYRARSPSWSGLRGACASRTSMSGRPGPSCVIVGRFSRRASMV